MRTPSMPSNNQAEPTVPQGTRAKAVLIATIMAVALVVAIGGMQTKFPQSDSPKTHLQLAVTNNRPVEEDLAAPVVSAIFGGIIAISNIIARSSDLAKALGSSKYGFGFSISNPFQNVRLEAFALHLGPGTSNKAPYTPNIFGGSEGGGSFQGNNDYASGLVRYAVIGLTPDAPQNTAIAYIDIFFYPKKNNRPNADIYYAEFASGTVIDPNARSKAEVHLFSNYAVCLSTKNLVGSGRSFATTQALYEYYRDYTTRSNVVPSGNRNVVDGVYNHLCARAKPRNTVQYQGSCSSGRCVHWWRAVPSNWPNTHLEVGYNAPWNLYLDVSYNWNKNAECNVQIHNYPSVAHNVKDERR